MQSWHFLKQGSLLTRTRPSGVARGGWGLEPPGHKSSPTSPPPMEWHFVQWHGEPPFWVPVSPPPSRLIPPCRPLILKSLATSLTRSVYNKHPLVNACTSGSLSTPLSKYSMQIFFEMANFLFSKNWKGASTPPHPLTLMAYPTPG